MIKTYKILAIGVIILFIGLSMSPATATKAKENETVSIEFGILNRDNSILKERLVLSQQEFAALQTKLSAFMETLQTKTTYSEVKDCLQTFIYSINYPFLGRIFRILFDFHFRDLPFSRAFVSSHGWGYRLDPMKTSEVRVYKPFTYWRYTYNAGIAFPSRTFILRPFPFKTRVLSGMQFGVMTHFVGLYIHVARNIPQKSYTFFMGSALYVGGVDFSLSPFSNLFMG